MIDSLTGLVSVTVRCKAIRALPRAGVLIVVAAVPMVFLLSVWTRPVAGTAPRPNHRLSDSERSFQGDPASPSRPTSYARCKGRDVAKTIATTTNPGSSAHIACPNGGDCDLKSTAGWYVKVMFFGSLRVTDGKGNTDSFFKEVTQVQRVPFITYSSTCPNDNCLFVIMPTSETYTLTFTGKRNGEMIMLEVLRGIGNTCPDEAVRYLNLLVPADSVATLKITPQGVQDVRYHREGAASFTSDVKPTAHVFAPAAWDVEGPVIRFSSQTQDSTTALVTITADDESRVTALYYSLDEGSPDRYDKPIKVDRTRTHVINAFADDKVGNRSALYTYQTKP